MKTLYELALEAIDRVFSDTSVPVDETITNLNALKDEIDICIKAAENEK